MAVYVRKSNGEVSPIMIQGYKGKDGETPEINIEAELVDSVEESSVIKDNNNFTLKVSKSEISERDKVDYMGNAHETLKETNDANVEYVLGEINTVNYEGQQITATNTFEKQVKRAILKGSTKYKDIETGEILDEFDPEKSLELVSVKMPVLTTLSTTNLFCVEELLPGIVIINNFNMKSTDFISVESGEKLWFNLVDTTIYTWAKFYTEDKTEIIQIQVAGHSGELGFYSKSSHVVPDNAKYMKVFVREGHINSMMVNRGNDYLPYEKGKPYKSNTLTTPSDLILRSNSDIYDELDLITGKLTQRIGEDNEVLAQEVIKTVDLKGQKVYSYKDTTHYECVSGEDEHPHPTLSIDVPTNLSALASDQINTINAKAQSITTLELEVQRQEESLKSSLKATEELLLSTSSMLAGLSLLNEREDSDIVKLYKAMLKHGLKTIDEIPDAYKYLIE